MEWYEYRDTNNNEKYKLAELENSEYRIVSLYARFANEKWEYAIVSWNHRMPHLITQFANGEIA